MIISKRILLFFAFLPINFAHAGVLLQFEYPALLILESKDKVYGYYGSALPKVSGVRPYPVECRFFFYSTDKSSGVNVQYPAKAFLTKNSFEEREKSIDSPASIFHRNSGWIIQLRRQDAGCDSAAGWNFRLGPDDQEVMQFEVIGSVNALYLRLVIKKASIFNRGKSFASSRVFLVPGDVVAVVDEKEGFSKIRFMNSKSNQTIEGWVKAETLVNPFPN
jgi:hypothetical protein